MQRLHSPWAVGATSPCGEIGRRLNHGHRAGSLQGLSAAFPKNYLVLMWNTPYKLLVLLLPSSPSCLVPPSLSFSFSLTYTLTLTHSFSVTLAHYLHSFLSSLTFHLLTLHACFCCPTHETTCEAGHHTHVDIHKLAHP